jgi:hypothetical protein
MSGYATTPNYNLRKPIVGADNDAWGGDWNTNADTLDTQLKAVDTAKLPIAGGAMTGPLTVAGGAVHQAGDSRYGFDYYWNDPVNGGVGGGIRTADGAFVWGPAVFKTLQVLTSASIADGTANLTTLSVTGTTTLGNVNAGAITLSGAFTPAQVTVGGQTWAAVTGPLTQFVSYSWSDGTNNIGPYISPSGVLTVGDAQVNANLTLGYTPTQAAHAVNKSYVDNNFIGPPGGTVASLTLTAAITGDQQAATKAYVDSAAASGGGGGLQGLTSQRDFPYPPMRDPKRDYGAIGNGVVDDSVAVNACIAAAIAAGERFVAINDTFNVPTLTITCGDVLFIGVGKFVGTPIYVWPVPPFAPSPPRRFEPSFIMRTHAPHTTAKLRAGTPVVAVLTGESTAAPMPNGFSVFNTTWGLLPTAMSRSNPGKQITWYNRAIGGQTWTNLDGVVSSPDTTVSWYTNPSRAWLAYIQDLNPDIVFIMFGGNDGTVFHVKNMLSVLAKLAAMPSAPDVVIMTSNCYPTHSAASVSNAGIVFEAQMHVQSFERSWSETHGIGYVDTGRVNVVMNRGVDVANLPVQRDPDVTGGYVNARKLIPLPFTWPKKVWGYGGHFYVAPNGWAAMGGELRFDLGTYNGSGSANAGGLVRVGRDSATGNLYYQVDVTRIAAGAEQDLTFIPKTVVSSWPLATGDESFHLTIANGKLVIIGMTAGGNDQYYTAYIGSIPRFGAPCIPQITCAAGSVPAALYFEKAMDGYATGLSVLPDPHTMFMPFLTDSDWGGSNSAIMLPPGGIGAHPSAFTATHILSVAIDSCDFAAGA